METTDKDYIEFTKMHGAGNDYVYITCLKGECPANDYSELAVRIADRHFGVGGDGLIVILPSEKADFRMRMFNADGSEAQMCGNASRCIGRLLHDKHLTTKTSITLETLAGIKVLHLNLDRSGDVESVTVDMGKPELDPGKIPVKNAIPIDTGVSEVELDSLVKAVAVNMGNPHGVIFTEDLSDENVLGNGPEYETHEIWPEKANIEFAAVRDSHSVEMRVWERGSGETLACGTGACATAVAGILTGRLESPVRVLLPGGCLDIDWPTINSNVMMTGPAETVADGRYYLPENLRCHKPAPPL